MAWLDQTRQADRIIPRAAPCSNSSTASNLHRSITTKVSTTTAAAAALSTRVARDRLRE